MRYGAFKGCTAYEAFIGRLWIRIPYWRFLKVGCWPSFGYDNTNWDE